MEWVQWESRVFWTTFSATFLLVAWWENHRPNRAWTLPAGRRWTMHGLLYLCTGAIGALLKVMSPVGAAILAQQRGWGLFALATPTLWVQIPATLLWLDFVKYGAHRLFHAVPWLWPIHRVHHSDPDFDVSTSIRFHPAETLLMLGADVGAIFVLGAPPEGVLLTGFLANIVNISQHANANLPSSWEQRLKNVVLTARAHRIHHSDTPEDERTNFGEIFPWWDLWMGTYARSSVRGESMCVGLGGYQDARSLRLLEMLTQPLRPGRNVEPVTTSSAVREAPAEPR